MPQAYPLLQITNGTTTITILDGSGGATSYRIQKEWAPQVATRRRSALGGRAPFTDVIETLPLWVTGATSATLLDNINNLCEVLDEAGRWFENEDGAVTSPVVLKYWPQGSALSAALQAVLIRKLDESPDVELPPSFSDDAGIRLLVRGVPTRFTRRGLWLLDAAFSSTSSSSPENGNVMSTTLSETLTTPSPVKLSFSGFVGSGATGVTTPSGYVFLLPSDKNWLRVVNASGLGTGAPWTAPNDAASNARGTTVLRYTPTVTTQVSTGNLTIASSPSNTFGRRLAVFAMVRNNDATKTYQISATLTHLAESYTTPVAVLDGSSTAPRSLYIGDVVFRKPHTNTISTALKFNITASATGGTMDIDYVVVACMDEPDLCHVIAIDAVDISAMGINGALTIDHASLTEPSPVVSYYDGSSYAYPAYRGNAYLMARSAALQTLLMMQTGTKWRIVDASGTVVTSTCTTTVSKGFLSPQ